MEHLNHIIRLFFKNALLLFILPVITMVSLWYLTKDQPQKYEVRSKFLYDFGGESTNVNGESLSLNEIYIEFLNTLEIIKSRKLVEKLKAQIALGNINETSDAFDYNWPIQPHSDIIDILEDILADQRPPYLNDSELELVIKDFYATVELSSEAVMNAISGKECIILIF